MAFAISLVAEELVQTANHSTTKGETGICSPNLDALTQQQLRLEKNNKYKYRKGEASNCIKGNGLVLRTHPIYKYTDNKKRGDIVLNSNKRIVFSNLVCTGKKFDLQYNLLGNLVKSRSFSTSGPPSSKVLPMVLNRNNGVNTNTVDDINFNNQTMNLSTASNGGAVNRFSLLKPKFSKDI